MEAILQSLGYSTFQVHSRKTNLKQIQDALQHCNSVEEAIVYIPGTVLSTSLTIIDQPITNNEMDSKSIPDVYCIDDKDDSVIDIISDESEEDE